MIFQIEGNFDRNGRMHGQIFNHEIASFTKWNWEKSKFCMVVKSRLLFIFLKNQACFQTYPSISGLYRFCETGLKYIETGSKYYDIEVQLWLAISQHYMRFSSNFIEDVKIMILKVRNLCWTRSVAICQHHSSGCVWKQHTKFYGLFYVKN